MLHHTQQKTAPRRGDEAPLAGRRLEEGHVFRKLDAKGIAFIEYAPLETAWVPVLGDNYLYIYCLWTAGELRGKGYGRQLMEYCIAMPGRAGAPGSYARSG